MFSRTYLALRRVHLKPPEKWVTEPNQMSFVFPEKGSGEYVSRSVTQRISPGDVLIVNPTGEGKIIADKDGEITFCFFQASHESLFPLFTSGEIRLLNCVCEGFKAVRLIGAATGLARECHRLLAEAPPQFGLDYRGQLLRVVAAIMGAEFGTMQPHLPGFVGAEDHFTQVLKNLTTDELISLPVAKLATQFGTSKRHLSRLFRHHFGFSVAAMKMEIRLLKAVSLLRDPDAKIINVAEECGFNYLGFFNACFKKRFGVTPGQRRMTIVEAEGQSLPLTNQGPVWSVQTLGLSGGAGKPKTRVAASEPAAPVRLVITVKPRNAGQAGARVVVRRKGAAIPEPRTQSQPHV